MLTSVSEFGCSKGSIGDVIHKSLDMNSEGLNMNARKSGQILAR